MLMKKTLLITLVYLSVSTLVGCNNKKSSSLPPPGCPAGQVATPAGCAPPGNIVPPVGYIPPNQTNGLYQYYASKTDYMSPGDTLTPTTNYTNFLRDALGVCDRCSTSIGEGVQCDSWLRGFNMMMISLAGALNSNHQIAFYSTPYISQSYFQFAWQFPKIEDFFLTLFTGVPPPSCNQGQFSPYWASDAQFKTINTDNGFVLAVDHGPYISKWNLYKFRVTVPVGKIGDPSFDFQLSVIDKNGNTADLATGTLTRCQTFNCSMF